MTTPEHLDWHCLFSAALDDQLSPADADRLRELLKTNAEARKLWFLYHDNECGLAEMKQLQTSAVQQPVVVRRRWLRWGPLPAAAAGLLIGLLTATTVFASVMPSLIKTWSLLQFGFEDGSAPLSQGVPYKPGRWSGDFTAVTGVQQGITPASGTKMLQFLRADFEGKTSTNSYSGDLYQLIDVRAHQSEIVDGAAVVNLSAAFNAFAFPDTESYNCSATIFALDAETATNAAMNIGNTAAPDSLAMANKGRVNLDRLPETWQPLTTELRLPPNTDFILIRLGIEHSSLAQRRATFDGHYLDDIQVTMARRALLP